MTACRKDFSEDWSRAAAIIPTDPKAQQGKWILMAWFGRSPGRAPRFKKGGDPW
jgi:hypothetical protein